MLGNFLVLLLICQGYCCELYLAPSKLLGLQRGIFSGKAYAKDSPVDYVPTLLLNSQYILDKQISNYVFRSNDKSFTLALFGTGMFYNHKNSPNVRHYYSDDPPDSSEIIPSIYSQPYTTYPDMVFVAESDIEQYEEIFVSYGDSSWFNRRNITLQESPKNSSYKSSYEELQRYGHCLSDVYINQSTLPLAGKGLFAKRSYLKGEIVTISPVLFISKKALMKLSDTSVILNYCICSEISDVCILPTGQGVMINHGGKRANVEIEWYDWGSSTKELSLDELSMSVEDLEKYQATPLDIAYRASRNIDSGEEIFLSYGEDWELRWMRYLHTLQSWNQKYNHHQVEDYMKPQFRAHLVSPPNFFPSSWHLSNCTSQKSCSNQIQMKLNKRRIQAELKEIQSSKEFIK